MLPGDEAPAQLCANLLAPRGSKQACQIESKRGKKEAAKTKGFKKENNLLVGGVFSPPREVKDFIKIIRSSDVGF